MRVPFPVTVTSRLQLPVLTVICAPFFLIGKSTWVGRRCWAHRVVQYPNWWLTSSQQFTTLSIMMGCAWTPSMLLSSACCHPLAQIGTVLLEVFGN